MDAFETLSLIFSISGLIEKLLMDCNEKMHISAVNKWVLGKKMLTDCQLVPQKG